jgi:hypothetical protein
VPRPLFSSATAAARGDIAGGRHQWNPEGSAQVVPPFSLLPACLRGEGALQGRMRGGSCKLSHPHPAFRATFSPHGGRGEKTEARINRVRT